MVDNSKRKNKKVLMLSYYFPPDMRVGSLRSRKYAEYLDNYGWDCDVITASFGRDKKVNFPETVKITSIYCPDISKFLSLIVNVYRSLKKNLRSFFLKSQLSDPKDKGGSSTVSEGMGVATKIQRFFLLPDSQFLWIILALPISSFKALRCDVIYSSAWPLSTHVLGLLAHKITRKPWVADYRDEWTLNTQWFPPTRFHRWLGEILDAACVKNAEYIVNTTEIRTQNFIDKFGGNVDKYITIHNGYDERDIKPYRNMNTPVNKLTITNIGSLYGGRDIRPFLRVLSECIKSGKIKKDEILLKLIGVNSFNVSKFVDDFELNDSVEIFPRMSQSKAFEHLGKSHVALLVGSDMERFAMTTKVYEYAGMGKKIFALVPKGPVHNFVISCGGICAQYNDENEVKQAFTRVIEEYFSGRLKNNLEPMRQYERRNLTRQQAKIFDLCIEKDREKKYI